MCYMYISKMDLWKLTQLYNYCMRVRYNSNAYSSQYEMSLLMTLRVMHSITCT